MPDAVAPVLGGNDPVFTPVNSSRQLLSASQYRCTIQSSATSCGMYSCSSRAGVSRVDEASSISSAAEPTTVVPATAGARRRTQGAAFLTTTGNRRGGRERRHLARAPDAKAHPGTGNPCSWPSADISCLLASLRASPGSAIRGNRKYSDSSSACSASSTAASSSTGTATARRPIRRPIPARSRTRSAGSS